MQPDRVIIGSGKLATALIKQIATSNSGPVYLVARNDKAAGRLLDEFPGIIRINYSEIPDNSICHLAISDQSIATCAHEIKAKNCVLIHFSGATSINVLHGNAAVVWPVHSFGNQPEQWNDIPLVAEVSSESVKHLIEDLANVLGARLVFLPANQREQLHMLAVFVNNFSNHLFKLAHDYCQRNNLDFSLLTDLILSGAQALKLNKPAQLQTGPAARNDESTIAKHIELLRQEEGMQYLYKVLSDSIRKF
jgi:predicted short-subunit dehydrogenase-like oxidoreductase (DUF2520 family)